MSRSPPPSSLALVVVQMTSLVVLSLPWHAGRFAAVGFVPIAFAVALVWWTLRHNRPGNFGILPEPRPRATLVTTGPYARVRHPMYSAVLLYGAGCALGWWTLLHAAALVVLVIVLDRKARREERLLTLRYPGYAGYVERTGRFLPRGRPERAR